MLPAPVLRALLVWISVPVLLAGCATHKDRVLPQDGKPMRQIYEEHFASMGRRVIDNARSGLKGGPGDGDANLHGYVRSAHEEIENRFPRLPNPVLVMFVYPHLAGSEGVPVPGYATRFRMYERTEYALPGEVPERQP